jgi:hypothetical protein
MTIAVETIQDSKFRTIVKAVLTSTHAAEKVVDASTLVGWVSAVLSKTNLASVSWSVSTPIQLIWTGSTTAPVALHLNGNGIYGGSNGMPAIANLATGGVDLGDLVVTSAAASVGFVVVVCHKVPNGDGTGWTA